jgi:hypothetical protein
MPGLRRLLQLFAELAALHDRGRCGSRFDPGKVRQRQIVRHALRRRPLFGIVRQGRRRDVVHHLCGAARGMPDLHARRSRMRDGAEAAWVAGANRRPCERRDPYRVIHQLDDGVNNLRKMKFGGYGSLLSQGRHREAYAVTASTRSSSSISSSIGAKVESGLVDSVIGLRLP